MAEPQRVESSRRMSPKQSRPVSTSLIVIAFIFVAGIGYVAGMFNGQFSGGFSSLFQKQSIDLSSVQETYRTVLENFDGKVDDAALIEGANKGLVSALGDEYTVYMNEKEASEFDDSLSGNIGGGVGMEVGLRAGVPTAVRILRDNPAEEAGVQAGDVIVAVNDDEVQGKSVNDIVTQIRGDVGTTVKLTVLRDGNTKDFTITRAQVTNPSVYGSVQNGVGVMTMTRFDNDTGRLARSLASEFKAANVKGVVLDLRGNGGGFVTAAQDVAGIWLSDKVVVVEKSSGKVVEELKTGKSPILEGVKTVVLVNESSASASEIVAGALRDHKAATLVGETTFGKGSVQKLLDLPSGSMLKVTVARWYTPGGVNISEMGIKPDREVLRSSDDVNANRDPQLDAAVGSF